MARTDAPPLRPSISEAGLLVVSLEPFELHHHSLTRRNNGIPFRTRIGVRRESLGKIRIGEFFLAGVL